MYGPPLGFAVKAKQLAAYSLTATLRPPSLLDDLLTADRARFGPLVKALGIITK